ncbi:MAG: sulfite exporter TauE/SafE family protein [Pirellulaceae bacterium]|nr:sulfite exporter TauE/SafE family protein [Pirellulaceae bacterium]
MQEYALALATALWLGLLTSISPCPLATNIAAISYIGHRAGNNRHVFLSGLLYTFGRTLGYVALAMVIVAATLSVPQLARSLQAWMHLALGPLLILVGMVLLGLLSFDFGGLGLSESLRRRVEGMGVCGALVLGVAFALAFCPTSAALYFGSLIPLSVQSGSSLVLPLVYGVGTAVPVLVFAFILAFSARSLGAAFNVLGQVERWARHLTGVIFIGVGLWFSAKYVFGWF